MNKPGIPLEDVLDDMAKRRHRRNAEKAIKAGCILFIAVDCLFLIGYLVTTRLLS